MCQTEEELKDSSKQSEEKVESTKPEAEPAKIVQTVSESVLDFDDDIPFAPIGLQYPQILNRI